MPDLQFAEASAPNQVPDIAGDEWRYDGGNGSARAQFVGAVMRLDLHFHPRKERGEPEPHYIVNARVSKEKGDWVFSGQWRCGSPDRMEGCQKGCDSGLVGGVIESARRIRFTEATNECGHNLSGLVLQRP